MKEFIKIIEDNSFFNFRDFYLEKGVEIPKGYYIYTAFGKALFTEQYFLQGKNMNIYNVIDKSIVYNYPIINKCIKKWLPNVKSREEFIENMKSTRKSLDDSGLSEKNNISELIINTEKGYIACLYKNKEIKVYGLKTEEERACFEYPYKFEIEGIQSTKLLTPITFEDNQETCAGELCRILEAVTNIYLK